MPVLVHHHHHHHHVTQSSHSINAIGPAPVLVKPDTHHITSNNPLPFPFTLLHHFCCCAFARPAQLART
jgi:hypothetical protein